MAKPAYMPSLAMLRSFEAVGRHQSMSHAAKELNVTHGAISRQVAALEAYLATALVRRRARGVELTEDGRRLFHGLNAGFDRIRSALAGFDREPGRKVTITTLPSFASRWLLPKLSDFRVLHPDIDVHVRTSIELSDLADPGIDFAIRYGRGHWTKTDSVLLLPVNAFPMCSPTFLERHGIPETPAGLASLPLIHNVTKEWWKDWFAAAGVPVRDLRGGIIVDEYELALQLAQDGHGVVLGRDPLIRRDLASGALMRLFDISVTPHFAYYLVREAGRTFSADAGLLFDWLRSSTESEGAINRVG